MAGAAGTRASMWRKRVRPSALILLSAATFVAGCWLFVANLVAQKPRDTLLGMAILLTGVPAYALWSRRRPRAGQDA